MIHDSLRLSFIRLYTNMWINLRRVVNKYDCDFGVKNSRGFFNNININ